MSKKTNACLAGDGNPVDASRDGPAAARTSIGETELGLNASLTCLAAP